MESVTNGDPWKVMTNCAEIHFYCTVLSEYECNFHEEICGMTFPISSVVFSRKQIIPTLLFNNSFQFSPYLVVCCCFPVDRIPRFQRSCFLRVFPISLHSRYKSCNWAWKCNSMMTVPHEEAILSSTSTLSIEVTCKHFISRDISRLLATPQHS